MRLVGAKVQRVEDLRILTGRGRYVDDVQLPGMLHAAFLRSPVAHEPSTCMRATPTESFQRADLASAIQ
jgi:CO/xanthine dehydrogenase Mo-binding subunit